MSMNKYFEALSIIEWVKKEINDLMGKRGSDVELQNIFEELGIAYNELTDFEQYDKVVGGE